MTAPLTTLILSRKNLFVLWQVAFYSELIGRGVDEKDAEERAADQYNMWFS